MGAELSREAQRVAHAQAPVVRGGGEEVGGREDGEVMGWRGRRGEKGKE